jgi:Pvc16 N-terminal domain
MTDFQGIGAVSATLRTLLKDRAELPAGSGTVLFTVGPPRSEAGDGTAEKARVNLFLYRVTENGSLKNQELPGRASSNGYGHPPLSVDLHYLLTAYGSTAVDEDFVDETRAHHLLGSAMRVLHDYPVVTDDLRTVRAPVGQPILDTALLGEFERVKLSLDQISLEDLSKVWTALTLPYRASAAYKINVVQIESRRPTRSARPVGEPPAAGPRVAVVPMRRPRIRVLAVRRPTDPPDRERPQAYARIGDTLVIHGSGLGGERTHVTIGSFDATAAIASAVEDRLTLVLPDDPALQPGGLPVQIRVDAPGVAAPLAGSNVAVFSLVPRVDDVVFRTGPKRLRVTGARLFAPDSESVAILGDRLVASAAYTTSRTDEIAFRLPNGVAAGTYSLRVRVNGAESIDDRTVTIT